MKRTKIRRKSKSEITKIQDQIWELCKQLTRKRYGNVCYTCGSVGLAGGNWHTGHLFAKASLGAYLKYDLRVLRPQCYHCNINLGGLGAEFYRRMFIIEGKEYLEKIQTDKNITVKAIDHYRKILKEYQELSTVL